MGRMRRAGDRVALTLAKVDVSEGGAWRSETMSGLFELIEHWVRDPAAYVTESGWDVRLVTDGPELGRLAKLSAWEREHGDPVMFWISDEDLIEQVDPKLWSQLLQEERMMAFAGEAMLDEG